MRGLVTAILIGTVLVAPGRAFAQGAGDAQARAAGFFDEGVSAFERADFAAAARAFLRADDAIPSSDALKNAIVAARRANDHLLAATAAERAIERDGDPELVREARVALADAAPKLARLVLDCAPAPCSVTLDGAPVEAGARWVLPGSHALAAEAEDGNVTNERLSTAAGVTYRVVLQATRAGQPTQKAAVSEERETFVPPSGGTKPEPDGGDALPKESEKPLPPGVFYAGVGLTVALAGVVTWSGLDVLSAKDDLPDPAPQSEIDDVRGRMLRTDVLLATTILVGGATVWAGVSLVDWSGGEVSGVVVPTSRGAALAARGRF